MLSSFRDLSFEKALIQYPCNIFKAGNHKYLAGNVFIVYALRLLILVCVVGELGSDELAHNIVKNGLICQSAFQGRQALLS